MLQDPCELRLATRLLDVIEAVVPKPTTNERLDATVFEAIRVRIARVETRYSALCEMALCCFAGIVGFGALLATVAVPPSGQVAAARVSAFVILVAVFGVFQTIRQLGTIQQAEVQLKRLLWGKTMAAWSTEYMCVGRPSQVNERLERIKSLFIALPPFDGEFVPIGVPRYGRKGAMVLEQWPIECWGYDSEATED